MGLCGGVRVREVLFDYIMIRWDKNVLGWRNLIMVNFSGKLRVR